MYGLRWGRVIALSVVLFCFAFGGSWYLSHDAAVTRVEHVSAETPKIAHEKILASTLSAEAATEMQENSVVFSEAVRSNNPFLMRSVQRSGAAVPTRTLPSIPAVSFPRPAIPSIAARPLSPQENAGQHTGEIVSAPQKEPTEKKYSDPIAFIRTGAGSAVPSDAITYYGGDHLTVGEQKGQSSAGEK